MIEVNKGGEGLEEKEWQEKLVMMLVRNLARPHCSLLVVHTAQLQGQLKLFLIASSPPFDICYNSTSTPFFRLYTKIAEFTTKFMRWFNISF